MSSNSFNALLAATVVATTHAVPTVIAAGAGANTAATDAGAIHGAVNIADGASDEVATSNPAAVSQWLSAQFPTATQRGEVDVAASATHGNVQAGLIAATAITNHAAAPAFGPSNNGQRTARSGNLAPAPVLTRVVPTAEPAPVHPTFHHGFANVATPAQVFVEQPAFPPGLPILDGELQLGSMHRIDSTTDWRSGTINGQSWSTSRYEGFVDHRRHDVPYLFNQPVPPVAPTIPYTTLSAQPSHGQQPALPSSSSSAAQQSASLPSAAPAATASAATVAAITHQSGPTHRISDQLRDLLTEAELKEIREIERLVKEKPTLEAWAEDPKNPLRKAKAHAVINKYATDFWTIPRVDPRRRPTPPTLWTAVKDAATGCLKRKRDDDDVGPVVKRARIKRKWGLSAYKKSGTKKHAGGKHSKGKGLMAIAVALLVPPDADEVPMNISKEVMQTNSKPAALDPQAPGAGLSRSRAPVQMTVTQTHKSNLTVREAARSFFQHHVSKLPRQAKKPPAHTPFVNALLGVTDTVGLTRTKRKCVRFSPYDTYLGPRRSLSPPPPEPVAQGHIDSDGEDDFSDVAEDGSDSEDDSSDSESGDDAGRPWDIDLWFNYPEDEAVASSSAAPTAPHISNTPTAPVSSPPTVNGDMSAVPNPLRAPSQPDSNDQNMHHLWSYPGARFQDVNVQAGGSGQVAPTPPGEQAASSGGNQRRGTRAGFKVQARRAAREGPVVTEQGAAPQTETDDDNCDYKDGDLEA